MCNCNCSCVNCTCKTTATTTAAVTATAATQVCGWIYPGAPATTTNNAYNNNPQTVYSQNHIDIIRAQYFSVNADGTISLQSQTADLSSTANAYSAGNVADIKAHSTQQYTTVSGSFPGIQQLWSSATNVNNSILTLVQFVVSSQITGVDIDFEDFGSWVASDYTSFKSFITALGNALHAVNKKLIICGPTWSGTTSPFVFKYSDFVSLPIDYISPMTYDNMWDNGAGSAICPLDWLKMWTNNMLAIFPVSKIIIGIPAYGYSGTTGKYDIVTKTLNQIKALNLTGATRDSASGEMMATVGNKSYVYNDQTSMGIKKALVTSLGVTIVSVWHLGGNDFFAQ